MSVLGTLQYIIGANTQKLMQGLRDSEKQVTAFGKRVRMSIGNAMKGVAGQFAAAFAIQAMVRDAVRSIQKFDQAQADLAAVLGDTRENMKGLTLDAKRLGSTTVFSANQVSMLQKEFAKLGFTKDEILDVTEATLQLAAATGEDLARSAGIAGATVRGFGLEAKETQRVVDVMAKSFSTTALDLSKFEVAMRAVAPVANNAGASIEETTALLGILANRGIDASTAGTQLRNVFLTLADKGMTWNEAMQQILESTNKNETALDLFGKRTATVGSILAATGGEAEYLTEMFDNAAGSAQEMADKQLDTLTGRITLLKSAWEGFILSLDAGEGYFSNASRNVIDFTSELLNMATAVDTLDTDLQHLAGNEWWTAAAVMGKDQEKLNQIMRDYEAATGDAIGVTDRIAIFFTGLSKELLVTVENYRKLIKQKNEYARPAQIGNQFEDNDPILNNMIALKAYQETVEDTKAPEFPIGSIADYMDQIKQLQEEMKSLTTLEDVAAKQAWIDMLTMKIKHLTGEVKNSIDELNAYGAQVEQEMMEASDIDFDPTSGVQLKGMNYDPYESTYQYDEDGDQFAKDAASAALYNEQLSYMNELMDQNVQVAAGMVNQLFVAMADDEPLKAMVDAVKALIVQLAIAAGLAAVIAALTGGGGAGFGAAFKGAFGNMTGFGFASPDMKIPAYAEGGITNGATLAMVGDNASGKEAIIPLEKIGQFLDMAGTSGGTDRLVAEVSGDQLRFILNRADQTHNRFN